MPTLVLLSWPRGAGAGGGHYCAHGVISKSPGVFKEALGGPLTVLHSPSLPPLTLNCPLSEAAGGEGAMPVLAPPHLDDHESQLALQQEEEALANAIGGVPSLGTRRDRLWPLRPYS